MHNYRFKEGFSHTEKGQRLEAGAVVTMSDRRYHSLRDRFELIEEYEEIPAPVDPTSTVDLYEELLVDTGVLEDNEDDYSEWVAELSSLAAKPARTMVAVVDEVDILLALLESESRKTVVAAIEDRIEALSQ